MARLVVFALALLVTGGIADPVKVPQKIADPVHLQRQLDLMSLYFHPHEPNHFEEQKTIASTYDIEKNIEHYSNVTAVKLAVHMLEYGVLPRGVPFTIYHPEIEFQVKTFFNVLFSAKDYTTFWKTAVYLRDRLNEGLFVYILSVAIVHRPDTQGIVIPPIYEVFPSYFYNGQVMTTAQRLNTHGHKMIDYYPSTYVWDNNVVIRWNYTFWPYYSSEVPVSYFTHDHGVNAFYYNRHLTYPRWLGADVTPLAKDKRGEDFWFLHKQIVARYYMERLSNGLGEIPELTFDTVEQGYTSGLVYHNGIPYPVRPNYFDLTQPELADEILKLKDYELRIQRAIDMGYFINNAGELVNIRTPEAIDVLGRLIEANVDSPNAHYYKNFIGLWKIILGNTNTYKNHPYYKHNPLVVPGVLENYQTALRDPAWYMIWKRVLNLFTSWQKQLPLYKPEELAVPSVQIQKVEVDKLVTYFEQTYVNITNHLHLDEHESKTLTEGVSVVVQRPRLNHKVFKVKVNVKSDVAKRVVVRFFLAPKYDSKGVEIPLSVNTENFFMFDEFVYDLPQGETVIKRDSTENFHFVHDWTSAHEIYEKAESALHGNGQFILDQTERLDGFPHRLLLPKGRVGGMPFVLFVYISEFHAPKTAYGTGFDRAVSLGLGSGARHIENKPLGFPLDRPLHEWQIEGVHNAWLQDVLIFHKHTPEIDVPHFE